MSTTDASHLLASGRRATAGSAALQVGVPRRVKTTLHTAIEGGCALWAIARVPVRLSGEPLWRV